MGPGSSAGTTQSRGTDSTSLYHVLGVALRSRKPLKATPHQYICSDITAFPPGATMRPQVSSAPTVSSLVRTGRPAICKEYLYLPGANSSVGPFGDVGRRPRPRS